MKTRTILTWLLLASLIVSTASCGGTSAGTDTTTADPASETTGEPVDPLMDDLGEFDFEGYEYRVLSVTYVPNNTFTLFDTEENGEVLNDSLYRRNREIEERFNIVFAAEEDGWGSNAKRLANYVNANEDAYDMIMLINRDAFSAALQGYLMPFDELTHINLEKDYWLKDVNDGLTIDGKSFFNYSEESVYTFERTGVLAFNKVLQDEYNLRDYYQTVRDGDWTMDLMLEDMKTATFDMNGDSKISWDDAMGLTGHYNYVCLPAWISADAKLFDKDENDIPYFRALTDEHVTDVFDRIFNDIFKSEMYVATDSLNKVAETFMNGNTLFMGNVAGRLAALREMEDDFGVIPFPKFDENQKEYKSAVIDAWLHVVPVTNPDPVRTSVIMEALASGSARYVFPAYYEKAMAGKVLRDMESIEMLDLCRATRTIDLSVTPWLNDIAVNYYTGFQNVNLDFTSLTASLATKAETVIAEAVEKLNELE
ncbi:MAG: extracellular solute-binding protein [Ruminococcaceae bacterium]|nr:extracellular solute-binding protein [Oscillospiraceae bacterium]